MPKASTSIWGAITNRQTFAKPLDSIFPPGSPPQTVSAANDIDPSAEESTAEPLDGPLLLVSYRERIHKMEVEEANPFGSIWHMNATAYKTCVAFIYASWKALLASLKPNGIGMCDHPSWWVRLAVKVSDYMYKLILSLLIFLPGWAFVHSWCWVTSSPSQYVLVCRMAWFW